MSGGMDASTAGYAGMAQTAIGGITSAIGAFQGGEAQKTMYDYQAGIARLNRTIAEENANYARQVGEIEATQTGMKWSQVIGQTTTALASHGLDIRTGSAADVVSSQRLLSRMDQTQVRSNAAKTAYNYQVQGVQFGAQAQLDTLAGANAARAGMVNAASSVMGAASAVSSEWMRGAQLGLWSDGSTQALGAT